MTTYEPRALTDADRPALIALNNAEVPKVTSLDADHLARLEAVSDPVLVIGDPFAGFCVTVQPGSAYWSANYRWVSERREKFVYLDRVCIDPGHRRKGLGARLYRAVAERALASGVAGDLVLEVNTRPENPGSLAFHARLGFVEIGRAEPYGDGTEVAYLACPLETLASC